MTEKLYDVLIVGSGAAGGILAKELSGAGLSVIILEAGNRFTPLLDFRNDELFMTKLHSWPWFIDSPINPITSCGVGGSTLHWGGWSVRFHPADFKSMSQRGYGDDWPITFKDLEPYYEKVEKLIGVAGENNNPFEPPKPPYPMPPHKPNRCTKVIAKGCGKFNLKLLTSPVAINSQVYDARPPCNYCGFCMNGCMTGAKSESANSLIPKAEAKGAELRTDAFITRINMGKNDKAEGVTYIDRKTGKEKETRAKVIVIAANGIQTPRLLLNSTSSQFPHGLANSSGLVGKYLMFHLNPGAWGIFDKPIQPYKGIQVGGMIQDYYETDPKRGFAGGYIFIASLFGPVGVANLSGLWGEELKEFMRHFQYMAGIFTMGEDMPNEKNMVILDPVRKDEFGLPIPKIIHNFSENDTALRAHAHKKAVEILEAAGAKKVYTDPGQKMLIHFIGTTRMGNDPKKSGCNSFGQTHDVKNLFLAGSSIFVTSAPAPPTLTIFALAARTADYIIEEGKKGNI